MVDPKEANERTVETSASQDAAARKVWVKPRLESCDFAVTGATGPSPPGGDGSGSIS
jgi:hypothetical protein